MLRRGGLLVQVGGCNVDLGTQTLRRIVGGCEAGLLQVFEAFTLQEGGGVGGYFGGVLVQEGARFIGFGKGVADVLVALGEVSEDMAICGFEVMEARVEV